MDTTHSIEAKSILSSANGMNLYRGCTHGCIYCDSRSKCYGMTHAFEDIAVKSNAVTLLENTLRRKRHRCMVSTGAMCDPYMPIEKELNLTRRCIEVIERLGFGFSVITKSDLVLRDLDLLKSINAKAKCVVQMTLTTFNEDLCRILEPGVCTTARRIEVLKTLQRARIPTVVWLCPVLPFINDTEENLRGILDACFSAGVKGIICFSMGLTLREGNREYFYDKLDAAFPGMKQRYIQWFGDRYICNSPDNAKLMALFRAECRKHKVLHEPSEVFRYIALFEDKLAGEQLTFF